MLFLSRSLSEVSLNANTTVQKIEGLYNEVLKSSINNSRAALPHLNDSNAIDNQFFTELDKREGQEDYYSTAYFIFALIHSSLFNQPTEDKLLVAILPAEKVSIRDFFTKIRIDLLNYFAATQKNHLELMQNVTRWQNESADSIVISFLEFPETLKSQVPELSLMDYTKQGKSIVEGLAHQLRLSTN
ncbi:uncharacterized protein LOC133847772 [Drosophila sulfurigaster albostrigata]|uniref:uncharacterized protein LOC133847772 n=1 Tax=Drosophila sulfurigaster albostrigata TaxID=89887 RepID=UPI002D21D692|nr:uncharacterized protein LOC133847772 [Drosophila sulfurigaster albostrigata]